MRVDIVPVEGWHIEYVAEHCRQDDRNELMAIAGIQPLSAIWLGIENGGLSWSGLIDGVPVAVFGACPVGGMFPDMARPWLVGTDLIDLHPIAFLRKNKPYIKKMLKAYSYLVNYVDCRNVKAIEWLKWCGFKFSNPEPFGIYQLPFMRFEMGR